MDSMKELEKQAERLLGELTELRRRNRLLTGRVKKLEKTGTVLKDSKSSKTSEDSGGFGQRRAELKRRVERLVTRLEKLDAS
jgi:chromosome segregation ATPase